MIMLALLLLYQHCLKHRDYNYTRVHHGLDDEEQEFKKILDSQTDEIDDLFNFNEENDEELAFDASELEQIEMLENYRNNLVAASDPSALSRPETEGDDADVVPKGDTRDVENGGAKDDVGFDETVVFCDGAENPIRG